MGQKEYTIATTTPRPFNYINAVPSKLRPGPEKNFHIGSLLLANGYPLEALPWLQKANPSEAQALNLAVAYRQLAQFKKAVSILASLGNDNAAVWANAAMVAEDLGCFDQALCRNARAYELALQSPTITLNYAISLLRDGQWEKAWPLWERGRRPDHVLSNLPIWIGAEEQETEGKSLLICPEGGYGDLIWLMRYFPELQKMGFTLHVWTWDSLLPLLEKHPWIDFLLPASEGVSLLTEKNELRYDYQIPLMSIPAALGVKEPTACEPYISYASNWGIPPAKIKVPQLANLRIGICWAAEEAHTVRKHRSLPDELAGKIIESLPGISWVGLVPGRGDWGIQPLMEDANWQETARIIYPCDLVISVDTAVAHLAGAMGIPCWLLLPKRRDWKWSLPERAAYWYHNMRYFNQTDPISWDSVTEEVCQQLKVL